MKPSIESVMLAVCLSASCRALGPGAPDDTRAPLDPAPAVAAATLFAPHVVSTEAPEFATSFSPDGLTVYFNRASADRSEFGILESRFAAGRWSEPESLSFASGARFPDPFVSPDGSELYFSSVRAAEPADARVGGFDIWRTVRGRDGWRAPIRLDVPVNSPGAEVFVSATRSGELFFASDRSGRMEIYRAPRAGDRHGEPVKLEIAGSGSSSNPCIDPDGRFLVFVSEREGGLGGADLYVTFPPAGAGGAWSSPRNLGALVNSPFAEFAPALHPRGDRLFFTSERPGVVPAEGAGRPPGDIYSVPLAALEALRESAVRPRR